MREVSDEFLLGVGGMSATLVGLFLVGMFFYAETALRSGESSRAAMAEYIRASARIVLIVYAMSIALSLSLVVLEDEWSRLLFAGLSIVLVWANFETVRRLASVPRASDWPVLIGTEAIGTVITVALVVAPWAMSNLAPGRSELTLALLLAFAAGFIGIGAMALTAFDLVRGRPEGADDMEPRAPTAVEPAPRTTAPALPGHPPKPVEPVAVRPMTPPPSHPDPRPEAPDARSLKG